MRRMIAAILVWMLCAALICPVLAESENRVFVFPEDSTEIDLGDAVLTYKEADTLIGQYPKLEKIYMYQTIIETSEYEKLLEKYPRVRVECTLHLLAKHYVRTDATAYSTLHGSCGEHSSKALRGLQYCTNLLALDIGHNSVDDISFLAKLPKLRVLILACNNVRNISVLSQLKDLEYIELFSNDLRDISPLAELPHLIDLNIAYNANVKSLEPLKEIKTLKRLWISTTRGYLNKELVAEIRDGIPDAIVMTSGHPTANGWRDGHPHHEVIYKMFRQDSYIPFEDSYPLEDDTQSEE